MDQNELSHYGVLGMKWGKSSSTQSSKPSYKDMREDKRKIGQQEGKKAYKESGAEDKYKEAYDFGTKNHLDLDDGGGGSARAGKRYWKMIEDASALEDKSEQVAKTKAAARFVEKYGQTRVDSFTKHEKAKQKAIATTVVAAMIATPIALIIKAG